MGSLRPAASARTLRHDYPGGELAELATRVTRLGGVGIQTHVVFNNNAEDQGQRNARSMMAELNRAGVPADAAFVAG